MGKRFEGSEPTFNEMLAAYEILGLTNLLGAPGVATAYASRLMTDDTLEFGVLPGHYTAKEVEELRRWAI